MLLELMKHLHINEFILNYYKLLLLLLLTLILHFGLDNVKFLDFFLHWFMSQYSSNLRKKRK